MTELTEEQLAADREFARQQRELLSRIDPQFARTVVAMADGPPKDITARSYQMPPEAAILYRNQQPRGADPCHYRGVMKDHGGATHWVALWVRLVKGQKVLEIRRVPKTN
jgi:hypothetical protein